MIKIQGVSKSYQQGTEVLSGIDLEVQEKELVVLLGESGSGKTTLLKMINRLVDYSGGDITINGQSIAEVDPVTLRRKMGYVVQQTGLFPHLTIKENIELVCKVQGMDKDIMEQRVETVMEMVGLDAEEFLYRYPKQLSGGQAQRVGVARAYATEPDIILMDEPFSALDPITRKELQNELLRLQQTYPKTILFVTHDIDEAIKLADRIVLLNNGHIEQIGTPRALLLHPNTQYVSKFLGEKKLWKAPWLIRCKDIMSTVVSCISRSEKLSVAMEIIKNDKVKAIFATDENGAVCGKLTEKILMRGADAETVEQAMKTAFDYATPDTPVSQAVKLMNEKNVLYLPILDETMHLAGMLNMTDLMEIFSDNVLSETAVN